MADDTWCSPWLKPLTHTQVANTPTTVQHALVHAMVYINHAIHTHTKGRGPWIDGQSGIHNMPPQRVRDRLDGGQWTCERGQATCNTTGQKEAPLKPCSHHSSYTNNHHTITLTTQAWSWSLNACLHSLTHTRGPRQDKEHTTKPSQWCGWLAQ